MKKVNAILRRNAIALCLLLCITSLTRAQTIIAGWNTNGLSNFGPSPFDPTIASGYTNITGFLRSSGISTSAPGVTAASRAWGGMSWLASNKLNAIDSSDYFTFTVNIKNGYILSLTSIDTFDYRRSSAGSDTGVIQYSLDGINFVDITGLHYVSTSNSGASLGPINLSNIGSLQNISSPAIITFRVINWRATDYRGTWYVYDKSNSSASDFKISGTIAEVPSNYYRSVASGNWSTTSIWESSPTSTGPWLPALTPPTSSASGIEIQGGFVVTMDNNQIINGILRLTSGVLAINDKVLTLNNSINFYGGLIKGSQLSELIVNGIGVLKFATGGFNNYLNRFIIGSSGSITLINQLCITANPTPGSIKVRGSLSLLNPGDLVFKSSINGTARIDSSSANSISGEAIVETYMSARRSWRLLSVPTTGTQTINAAWQEGATNPTIWPNIDPKPGYGTHITFTATSSGYDIGPQQTPSIKKWNKLNGWGTINSTTATVLSSEPGYFLFVRGPRSTDLRLATTAPTSTTVLRSLGSIKTGPVSVPVTSLIAGGYVLIPNPYVSPINISTALSASNINPNEYVRWDQNIGGVYGVGGWVTVLNGTVSNPTTRFPNAVSTASLQISESFIGKLTAAATSANIPFVESDKLTTEFLVFRSIPRTISEVHAQLFASTDTTITNLDGTAVQFGQFTSKHALKFGNGGENIFIQNDSVAYAIESKEPLCGRKDSSLLRLTKLVAGKKYSILLSINESFDRNTNVFLKDQSADTMIAGSGWYDFIADSSVYAKRFVLIYAPRKKQHTSFLPVQVPYTVLRVYPNPVVGSRILLTERAVPVNGVVHIYDIYGKVRIAYSNNGLLSIVDLPSGLYWVMAHGLCCSFLKNE